MTHPQFTPEEIARFWSKVDRRTPDECWEWRGARQEHGYGSLRLRGKKMFAHRMAYLLCNGALRSGELVCHRCDNPPCCNPAHLFGGSQTDNMQDAKAKGRATPPPRNGDARRRLTQEQATEIRTAYAAGRTMKQLAAEFGISWESIRSILDNESYVDPAYVRITFRGKRQGAHFVASGER